MGIVIRQAQESDASEISSLILGVSRYSTLDPAGAGAEKFFASLTPAAIAGYIADTGFDYVVACDESERIVGVGAVRRPSHLFHLFVLESCHGRGIARRLWQRLLSEIESGGAATMTVYSTVFAVPVYEKFGFRVTGPTMEKDGIAFVPMERLPGDPSRF